GCTCAYLCEQWTGTSTRDCPAKAKNQSAIDLPFIECFWRNLNRFAGNSFNVEFLNQENGNHAYYNGTSYYSIHMKRLQTKHFLYAKPTYDFGLYKNDPE